MPYMNSRNRIDLAVSDTGTFQKLPSSTPASSAPVTGPMPTPRIFRLPIQ
jgi:hypothetical protein